MSVCLKLHAIETITELVSPGAYYARETSLFTVNQKVRKRERQ